MKFLRCFSHSSPVRSPFRVTFSLGAPVLIALAMASPLLAQGVHKAAANGPLPPSMQKSVQVMVEMNDAPAANLYAAALAAAQAKADAAQNYALAHPGSPSSIALLNQKPQRLQIDSVAASQIKSAVQQLDQKQQAMLPMLTGGSIGGKVIYRAQRAYNGIAMVVSPDKIAALAALPGVKAVHPMNPKYLVTTFSDIDFLNTRPAWTTGPLGTHGENIKVADIDTGLDYIHTDFGGSGSAADYSSTSDTSAVPNANFPTSKIPGGTDLVGDNYNASGSGSQLIPVPDNNPFDCAGHGTATASLIGGFGVTSAGSTYSGTYDASNPVISSLKIPPGFAPEAKIYPVRVFGCAGSTNVVVQAIEWAMTNGMDVINMSLGANEGFADDPDSVAATNAAAAGIIVCSAAGNAGDSYYIASEPGAAGGTLEVAASFNDQSGFIFDSNVTGNAPPAIAGAKFFSIKGSASAPIPAGGITGNVVYGVPNNATTAFTNAANINGNICLIDRGGTTFTDMVTKAFNAGATGVIVNNFNHPGADPILMSTAGQPAGIADVMISRTDRDTIVAASGGFNATTGVPATTVNVTINNDSGAIVHGGAAPDTIPTYSSRGPRLPDSSIKPDITAPAEVTAVAQSAAEQPPGPFSGSGVENFNGTSSATPHVAGEMTLLRQLHPSWTVEELRALAMNTATHDLFTDTTYTTQYGIGRIGAGRIDIGKAAAASVIAFGGHKASTPGLIGVSFGVVETPVAGSSTLTQNIVVENKGKNAVTYNVTYQEVTPVNNATMTFPTSSFTVATGQRANIPVQFTATGSDLKHVREASVASTQSGFPRQWLTEETGYAVFTPTSGPEQPIRVPLYAAVKPASSMHATSTSFVPGGSNTGSFSVGLSGDPVNTGSSLGFGFDILSLVKAFELQYQSAFVGTHNPPTDPNVIKYAGVTSDYVNQPRGLGKANTTIMFGAEKFGDAATPDFASSDTEIDFDTNPADVGVTFNPNFAVFLTNFGTGLENVFVTEVVDLTSFTGFIESFTNGLDASVADTNIYNNSGIIFPIFAQDIGLIGSDGTGNTKFQYAFVTFDRNGNFVDASNVLVYDLANPGLEVDNKGAGVTKIPSGGAFLEPFFYQDLTTNSVPVKFNGTNFQNNGSLGVWLLHMHNGDGNRSDVVAFLKPTITGFNPTRGPVGTSVTITGTNFGSGDTVAFNGTPSTSVHVFNAGKLVATVPPGATTGPITVSNAAGTASTAPHVFTVTAH
jgi:subtilisin family serine protease